MTVIQAGGTNTVSANVLINTLNRSLFKITIQVKNQMILSKLNKREKNL